MWPSVRDAAKADLPQGFFSPYDAISAESEMIRKRLIADKVINC